MSPLDFASIQRVHDCAASHASTLIPVDSEILRGYFRDLGVLLRSLGEGQSDPYWGALIRQAKRWRFEMAAAPLPFAERILPADIGALEQRYAKCGTLYPEAAPAVSRVLLSAWALSSCVENPLLFALRDWLHRVEENDAVESRSENRTTRNLLCVGDARLIPATEQALRVDPLCARLRVVSAAQLRGDLVSDTLFLVGAPRWFPDYLYSAPRATHSVSISYGWLAAFPNSHASFLDGALFSSLPDSQHYQYEAPPSTEGLIEDGATGDMAGNSELAEAGIYALRSASAAHSHELVRAIPVLLEGGSISFLDGEDGASAIVIDLAEIGKRRVHRAPVVDLEVGTFLLVREGGGGDFIVPVANQILGTRAPTCREQQAEWKTRLRDLVRSGGYRRLAQHLTSLGGLRANETNLRRWIWERSIKPQEFSDFYAIMRACDMDRHAEAYWASMTLIDRAHTKAGQLIRRRLLERVHAADLRQLEQLGVMSFSLPGLASGTLLACRIRKVGEEALLLPANRIGSIIGPGAAEWRG